MLEHSCRDLLLFCHKSIRKVAHWWWAMRSGSKSAFQFIPMVFDGFEVRTLCRPVMFCHTDLDKPFLYGPDFVHSQSLPQHGIDWECQLYDRLWTETNEMETIVTKMLFPTLGLYFFFLISVNCFFYSLFFNLLGIIGLRLRSEKRG